MPVIYHMVRGEKPADSSSPAVCLIADEDGGLRPLKMSESARAMSDGLNWGYAGSGPHALAHSLLRSAVGERLADRFFRDFVREVVSRRPAADDWSIGVGEIVEWVAKKETEASWK